MVFFIQIPIKINLYPLPFNTTYFPKMKYFLFVFSFISFSVFGQKQSDNMAGIADEQNLKSLCVQLFSSKTDGERIKHNNELLKAFEEVLNKPNSFELKFDSLKNYMGIHTSPDNKFKIINWNLEKDDKTYEYFGFIQSKYEQKRKVNFLKTEKTETIQLYPLIDKSAEIKNPENSISDNKKWFGMLYYKIILKKTKAKTYYTLLGYDLNDAFSKKKIIDVLTFDANGTPRFGADIFVMEKKYPKRVIFEYAYNCSMSLRYNTQKDSIVFDHLSPPSSNLQGQFQYYCTDMSYDGFGFKRGKWYYGMDLNPVNEKDELDKYYHDPHKQLPNKRGDTFSRPKKKSK
jgi:hypothetical protein